MINYQLSEILYYKNGCIINAVDIWKLHNDQPVKIHFDRLILRYIKAQSQLARLWKVEAAMKGIHHCPLLLYVSPLPSSCIITPPLK